MQCDIHLFGDCNFPDDVDVMGTEVGHALKENSSRPRHLIISPRMPTVYQQGMRDDFGLECMFVPVYENYVFQ